MQPRFDDYFRSLSAELEAQANRVRCLIGSAHWLSDGGHKESILRHIIERHMPSGTLVARGFIVNNSSDEACSREQDIFIVDTSSEAPLFNQGGLIITPQEYVYASVSVKSAFGKNEFLDALRTFASIPSWASTKLFFGSYHFGAYLEDDLDSLASRMAEWLLHEQDRVSMMVRISPSLFALLDVGDVHRLRVYRAADRSTAYFLARLLNHVSGCRSANASIFADVLDGTDPQIEVVEIAVPLPTD